MVAIQITSDLVAGILYGKGENNLDPIGLTTRAEAAAIFVRIGDKLEQ